MALLLRATRALRPTTRLTRTRLSAAAATATEESVPPVTLLSGFFGERARRRCSRLFYKTEKTLKVAVVVNDVAAVSVDDSIVKKGVKQKRTASRSNY